MKYLLPLQINMEVEVKKCFHAICQYLGITRTTEGNS